MKKNRTLTLFSALSVFASATVFASEAICPKPWICEAVQLKIPYTPLDLQSVPMSHASASIRAGYFPEEGSFQGNIIYFEGLGDSFINHQPLFSKLSEAGYRVIAFDYMGQGGSSGKMDDTRIKTIPMIGDIIWKKFARDTETFPQKTIIGWSTGGLAAYMAASENKADRIVLIAPGIVPNAIVGAGLLSWPPNKITLSSLTTAAPYQSGDSNPHLDPIRPNSPVKVTDFAVDLLSTARLARHTQIPANIPGLVLLSGSNDTYVDAEQTKKVLRKTAPHFKVVQCYGALHEIDNERESIREKAVYDILSFLE